MSQIFNESNKVIPITLIKAGPCFITQIKQKKRLDVKSSNEGKLPVGQANPIKKNDSYDAVQIGFERLKEKKIKKSQKQKPFRYLREFKGDISKYKIGQKINVSIFNEGDKVNVSGISKGKGFQGGVKRWGFAGKSATHGVKHEHRTLGSTGSTDAARVFKGKKMPGRMGYERITKKNVSIAKIDIENNLMAVKGAVPGRPGTLLEIKS